MKVHSEIISKNGDLIIGTTLDLSGGAGNNQDRGKSGPGGWAEARLMVKVLERVGHLGVSPGGGGYGGAGSGATFNSGKALWRW